MGVTDTEEPPCPGAAGEDELLSLTAKGEGGAPFHVTHSAVLNRSTGPLDVRPVRPVSTSSNGQGNCEVVAYVCVLLEGKRQTRRRERVTEKKGTAEIKCDFLTKIY